MKARTLSAVLILLGATGALADDMKMPVNASQLEWAPAPNFVPEGAQITVLSGNPSKDGPYVIRLKIPAGYKIPAHNHPTTEMVTVISGDFHLGMGDKLDEEKSVLLTAGGYAEAPAQMNHYAWASSPTIVEVQAGPFAIAFGNPADDLRASCRPRSRPHWWSWRRPRRRNRMRARSCTVRHTLG
jgi:quercetin dioxygenase-like cupin family protein